MAPDKKTNLIKFGFLCALVFWQLNNLSEDVVQPILQGDGLSWRRSPTEYFGSDFLHYYVSGVMSRSVDHLRIYDVPTHFPYINELIAPRQITANSCINFSPPMIAIMSVVSLIPTLTAYILWTAVSFCCGATGLALLLKRVGHLSNYQIAIFIVGTSASLSSNTVMKMGQWTWWLTAFFCFFFLLSWRRKQILSGIFLGLLTVKPQYCLPVLLFTAVEKRWLTLCIAGVTLALLCAWSAGLIGLDNVLHYPQIIAALAARPDLRADTLSHCSLRGFFSTFMPFETAITTTNILYVAALSVFTLLCYRHRAVIEDKIDWIWAIAILTALIFSPLMFQYDVVLVCVAAALTLKTLAPMQIIKMQPVSLRIWHIVFLLYPLFTWLRALLGNELNYLYAFVNLGLLACALLYLKHHTNAVTPDNG
ncbi:MAG: glycosyltransferase family 87 protein [Candidatus Obscuribacterales bacterium]|nr:glycosyltransferase family 87 protein [Candidatus Obscuribacterales bacterium]